ncbi:T9SS type A sorting domain-containing protein [Flavobacterium sp.]
MGPNPVNDILEGNKSSLHSITKYELFDMQGRLVQNNSLLEQNNF